MSKGRVKQDLALGAPVILHPSLMARSNDHPIDLLHMTGMAPSPCSVDPPPVSIALGQIPERAVYNAGLYKSQELKI
jgi:hypothetical protein